MREIEMKVIDRTHYWYAKDTGELHRDDGPAVEGEFGTQAWYQNGQRHRDGGQPAIEGRDREWWVRGVQHRVDGPAVEYFGGGEEWRVYGKLHRVNGPAVIHDHPNIYGREVEWYLDGNRVFSSTEYMEFTGLSQESMDKLIEQYGGF